MPDIDTDLDLSEILSDLEGPPKPVSKPVVEEEDDTPPELPSESPAAPTTRFNLDENDDGEEYLDPEAIMDSMGTTVEPQLTDIFKAWMHYHEFVIIKTVEELEEVVKQAFKTGMCSLDLETQGLDNRIYMRDPSTIRGPIEEYWDGPRPARVAQTVHKIVGYCLSPDGHTGYYVPVRHNEVSKNVDPIAVGKIIKRLCKAAQPVIKPEGMVIDPLASPLIEKAKVKLFFWHAKFDQEFLLPVTGIDFWHPESFEDGMLVYYCIYTNDKNLGLKDKSYKKLTVKRDGNLVLGVIERDPKNAKHELVRESPTGVPIAYEMIELKELFMRGRPIDFASLDPEEARYYACSDAICTYLHCEDPAIQSAIKDPKYAGVYRIEKQVVQVLRWMERNRIKIDHDYVRKLFDDARKEADEYRTQIVALAVQKGFNNFDPQSTQQLSDFLFASPAGLNITPKPEKTKNELRNQYKTDADTLEKLVENNPDINPILITIVKFRQVEKVIGTYLTGMLNNCDANSELRYQFKQTGAPTGRFTAPSGDPAHGYGGIPIHGIPSTYDDKKPKVATALRKAFVARPGYTMVKVDFAGEELRIVTNLSGEPVWIKEFNEGSGDLHTITAKAFFGNEITKQQRQQGKMANFSLVYGGGTMAIMRATKCSQQEAARRKANFDKAMPVFSEWVKKQKASVRKHKGVYTAFGRWMAVPDVDSPDKAVVAACERYSLNYPIQGSGADIMKMAMVMLYKEFSKQGWIQGDDPKARFMLTVHDEIVFEVKHEMLMEVMPAIERIMTDPGRMMKWKVQLEVEPLIDAHWDPKYDYHKIMKGYVPESGKKPKETDIKVGDRYYQAPPPWLKDILVPDYMKAGTKPDEPKGSPPAGDPPPPPKVEPQKEPPQKETQKVEPKKETQPSTQPPRASVPPTNGKINGKTEVLTVYLMSYNLTRRTVREVTGLCQKCFDPTGPVLQLVDSGSGEVLIGPEMKVTVNQWWFERDMDLYNLGYVQRAT
jgi:DNA polymerase I-like protein with 3'-5' exonuclease and polymerase domains